ncbi:MAG: hypothetical protein EHM89_20145 [Acidobacteria bacterium]|nr:MAG: hypothetical protein EHM89_20145 [Acidobacteriota bacterium]
MDQLHTLTGGATYRHARSGIWTGVAVEYGSGTPVGHGGSDDDHAGGDADHTHASASGTAARVPQHFIGNLSLGIDVFRKANNRPRLTLRLDVENVANNVFLIARDSEFSPSQFSIPRLVSVTALVRF